MPKLSILCYIADTFGNYHKTVETSDSQLGACVTLGVRDQFKWVHKMSRFTDVFLFGGYVNAERLETTYLNNCFCFLNSIHLD